MSRVLSLVKSIFENDTDVLRTLKIQYVVIESTSRCNLKCEMCPRNSFKQSPGDMDLNLYKKLSKYFYPGIAVNLAGWGEPLLHPRLAEMVKIAKEKGGKVGFTTNATLLDKETSEELIKDGLDFIDFSLDGGTQDVYERIRRGADFYNVINNIKKFTDIKNSMNLKLPDTSITFVMMKKNIHELPLMVRLTKDLKIDVLVAKNFNVLTNKEDIEQVAFSHEQYNEPENNFIKIRNNIISDTVSLANDLNVRFMIYPLQADRSKKCQLASTAIFISHTGEVAVCCATGYPVPRMLNRADIIENAKIIYGNMNIGRLGNILQTKAYLDCRMKAIQDITPVECKGCLLSEGL